jgi:hypothetical protein
LSKLLQRISRDWWAAAIAVGVVGLIAILSPVAAVVAVVVAIAIGVRVSLRRDLPGDRARRWRIGFRLTFLVAAMVVLAVVCRQGTSLLAVGVVFTIYVAAVTLWIRGQHQAAIDAVQDPSKHLWTLPYWISIPAVLVGLAFAGAGVWQHESILLVSGALLTYLGAGYLLMRFRMYAPGEKTSRVAFGLAALAVAGVLLLVGLLALEDGGTVALVAVGFGALIAPIGPAVLAEPAIRALQEGDGVRVAAVAGGGAVLLLAAGGIAYARVDTVWMLVAFGALALLVLAVVSSTQADIAAVIAAVTLMGVTAMSEHKPDALRPDPGDRRVLVALGDSYMSGEGADIFYDEGGEDENHCNRAPTAWAAMAGQTTRLFDSVAFLACSGARTFNVRHGMRVQYNEPGTQLDQADGLKETMGRTFKPSLVVVSLGGNDVGFSTIGMMCLAPGNCIDKRKLFEDNLDTVEAALERTYAEIRAEFPRSPVLVVPYPAPIHVGDDGPTTCDEVALSAKDMEFVSDFVPELNDAVAKAARSQHFYFLAGMENALADAHLQLCDPENDKRPGINFIGLRSVAGVAEQRFNPKNWYHNSLHPNERGHAAMLQVFEQWLADHDDLEPTTVAADGGAAVSGPGAVKTNPPCDLFDDVQSTSEQCTEAGAKWAKGQVSDALLFHGWWWLHVVGAALGAWLLGVALFGWWKPWWRDRGHTNDVPWGRG